MSYGKKNKAVSFCAMSPIKKESNEDILVGILSGKLSIEGWKPHMETFFNELPISYIIGVMEENSLNMQQLISVFEALPPVFQGKNFKEIIHA